MGVDGLLWTSYFDSDMMPSMDCLTELFLREAQIPLTLILCRIRRRRLADSAPPKGRGKRGADSTSLICADGSSRANATKCYSRAERRGPYTFLPNEPNLFSRSFCYIGFRYSDLRHLWLRLQIGFVFQNEPNFRG